MAVKLTSARLFKMLENKYHLKMRGLQAKQ